MALERYAILYNTNSYDKRGDHLPILVDWCLLNVWGKLFSANFLLIPLHKMNKNDTRKKNIKIGEFWNPIGW